MNLKNLNVQEMSKEEMVQVEGGWLQLLLFGLAAGVLLLIEYLATHE